MKTPILAISLSLLSSATALAQQTRVVINEVADRDGQQLIEIKNVTASEVVDLSDIFFLIPGNDRIQSVGVNDNTTLCQHGPLLMPGEVEVFTGFADRAQTILLVNDRVINSTYSLSLGSTGGEINLNYEPGKLPSLTPNGAIFNVGAGRSFLDFTSSTQDSLCQANPSGSAKLRIAVEGENFTRASGDIRPFTFGDDDSQFRDNGQTSNNSFAIFNKGSGASYDFSRLSAGEYELYITQTYDFLANSFERPSFNLTINNGQPEQKFGRSHSSGALFRWSNSYLGTYSLPAGTNTIRLDDISVNNFVLDRIFIVPVDNSTAPPTNPDPTDPAPIAPPETPDPVDPTPSEPVCSVQNFEDFEAGYGFWNDGGFDARRNRQDAPFVIGNYGVRLRGSSNSSFITSNTLTLQEHKSASVSFSYLTRSMERGDGFVLEISTDGGNTFDVLESWVSGQDFSNNQRQNVGVDYSGVLTNSTQFRIRSDASSRSDFVYIDNIAIQTCR